MGYAGRQNIYEATIRRMVTKALEAREESFEALHDQDTPQMLLSYLREQAERLGHTPWPGEIDGGAFLEKRFGSWQRAVLLAGLTEPNTPNRSGTFLRVKQEEKRQREVYRKRKAEKKILAEKRRMQQAVKKKESEEKA